MRIIHIIIITLTLVIILTGGTLTCKAQLPPLDGRAIFENKCTECHGSDGTKGRWGAKNLRISTLNSNELLTVITNGRGIMPRWGKKLTQPQILQVIDYIKTFRKN